MFYNLEMSNIFLEVQIQNILSSTFFIQKNLELSEMRTGAELSTVNQAGENECTFGMGTFLQSMEECHYFVPLSDQARIFKELWCR